MSSTIRRASADALRLGCLLLAWVLAARGTVGQCQTGWDATAGVPGTNGPIYTTALWDPDGTGPLPMQVVVGGGFTQAGGMPASRIAAWNPATGVWSTFGTGMDNVVQCLAVMPNGDLVAGGQFSTAGSIPALGIARWDGSAWSSFGGTTSALGGVRTLCVLPSGNLVAGGQFYFAGFTLVSFIALWNGSSWLPMANGMNNYVVSSAVLPSGDLVVGGDFTVAGGVPCNYIARWTGSGWAPLGGGTDSFVQALAVLPNGDLAAAGQFTTAGGAPANHVARWSPTSGTWSALGSGTNLRAEALTVLPGGDLIAGGAFTSAGGGAIRYVARWNGSAWSAVGIGVDTYVHALVALPSGGFIAGGDLTTAGGVPSSFFARACGNANWAPTGYGCSATGPAPALTLVGPPQIGGTFALAVNNLGPGLPVMVTGFSPANLSLAQIGLGFIPGCWLWVAPDLLQVLVPVAGASSWSLAIPNVPALAGQHLWDQVVVLDTLSAASNAGDGEIR